jgi:predicted transglutaminase-like cysteine proteinase
MPAGMTNLRWLIITALLAGGLVLAQVNLDRMQSLASSRYGQQTADMVAQWRGQIDAMALLDDEQKLVKTNDFFNTRIRWVQDPEAWGQKDYWATPLETMGNRMGDCEDFAIAKYATLILAGVDVNKLRITYVKAQIGGPYSKVHEAHMVLAYYATPSADPLILDSLISEVRPASRREDLTPVFGFNSNGLWVGGATQPATNDPGAKLSRWRDLLQRAAADGLG